MFTLSTFRNTFQPTLKEPISFFINHYVKQLNAIFDYYMFVSLLEYFLLKVLSRNLGRILSDVIVCDGGKLVKWL